MQKEKSLPFLKKIVAKHKRNGETVVFTNGCFDIIHPGHIKILHDAKEKGDILIVGINSDASIKKIKGNKRPILNEQARVKILSAFQDVDYVIRFNDLTPYKLINELRPDCLVKGGDWSTEKIIGREFVRKVFRVKLAKGFSTSEIIKKIVKLYSE